MISSVYIHIPFCEKICHYCDFTKFFYEEKMADDYLEALKNEISNYVPTKEKMRTIFVGGGTPTALNLRQLNRLLATIESKFDVNEVEEFTFEANPGDLTEDKIKLLKEYGVNRISMGAQVFDDEMLEQLGRLHRVKDVDKNINALKKYGINNVSLDLMYGLPGQTITSFKQSIAKALDYDLPHYSSYSLQIEPKTIFYQRHQKGKLHKPPEEKEAEMYQLLIDEMMQKGKLQYEISNFAEKGFESKHNLTYWSNDYYYGFGAGAHGYTPGKRIINLRPFPAYVQAANDTGKPVLHYETIGEKEQIEEELFLGLRKSEGVDAEKFEHKFGRKITDLYQSEIAWLKEKNWIVETELGFALTKEGQLFGNEVFQQFLLDSSVSI